MKTNWGYIKLLALSFVALGLYAFAGHRSAQKNVKNSTIEFVGEENLYLTQETVNKLLIQNYGNLKNVSKEKLALNTMENVLEANEMVKRAQVYLTVDGELTSRIVQRKPIARITGNSNFYLDDDGMRMPLSKNHSARVPIITGKISGDSLEDVYKILKYINEDEFFRKNVVGIHIIDKDNYQLKFRMEQFVVSLGGVDDLEEKFNNFKAFYTKANKDKTLSNFTMVRLEFSNQVVCTKI